MTAVATNGVKPAERKLDIGAGDIATEGWETLDINRELSPDFQHDLTDFPWPFEDNTFSELRAHHVLEHLQPVVMKIDWETRNVEYINTRIAVFNEMWRILKPGGQVEIEVPVFPYWVALADPTHISSPWVPQAFAYFCEAKSYRTAVKGSRVLYDFSRERAMYGIKEWVMLNAMRDEMGALVRVRLMKP